MARPSKPSKPEWRNWQTRRIQNPMTLTGLVGSSPTSGTTYHDTPNPVGLLVGSLGAASTATMIP